MHFDMTEDQQAFAETARQFAEQELAPYAAQWDREHTFPVEALRKAGELGFCGLYTPEDEGGLGLSRLDSSIIFEQLSMGCTTTTAMLTIHNMATWMIASWGQDDVKARWCPDLVTGEKLASYCLTEPGDTAFALNDEGTQWFLKRRYQEAMPYFYDAYRLLPAIGAFALNLLQCMVESNTVQYKRFTIRRLLVELETKEMNPTNLSRFRQLEQQIQSSAETLLPPDPVIEALESTEAGSGDEAPASEEV